MHTLKQRHLYIQTEDSPIQDKYIDPSWKDTVCPNLCHVCLNVLIMGFVKVFRDNLKTYCSSCIQTSLRKKSINGTLDYYIHYYPQKRLNGKTCGQVRKESLEQNEYAQYPIVPAARYVRYWNEIERKQKHQKEMIIEEVKNNPDQIGMGC